MSHKLALIIGNSQYEDLNLARLVTPDADVNALAAILRHPDIGAFDDVVTLVNQSAETIRRAVAGFFVGRSRDDLLLLYFSGHGIRDDRGQLFLAVKDTERSLLRGTAIPAAFVTEEMDNSRSRRQVLILDCCHSGAFSRGMKGAPGASVGTATAFEGTGSGRVVLTATDSTQYAWEGELLIGQAENSVFTHYLIQGLRSGQADTDADGHITLDELYNYIYELVIHATPMQTPRKWSYGQQGEIIIARNPHPVVKPAELPSDLQQTIDDPRPWVREGAVHELARILRGSQPGLALAAFQALQHLAGDDSRRVAAIAAEIVADYAASQPSIQAAQLATPASAGLSEPRAPARLDHQRPEAQPTTPENVAPQHHARQDTAQNVFTTARDFIPQGLVQPLLLAILGWTVVWAFGWVAGEAYGWTGTGYGITWLILQPIAGFITALALRRAVPSIRWQHVLLMTLGWAFGNLVSGVFYDTYTVVIGGIVRGAIGALITGLVLQRAAPSVRWQHILIITLGWTIAWAIAETIGTALYNALDSAIGGTISLWAIPGAIMGATGGAIGSLVMFWQLAQAHHSTSTD